MLRTLLIAVLMFSTTNTYANEEQEVCTDMDSVHNLIESLTKNYDSLSLPQLRRVALPVQIELHVQQINDLSVSSGDFEVDIFFSEIWVDERLNFQALKLCRSNMTLTSDLEEKLWTPNVCAWNAKMAATHHSPSSNKFLILHSDGKVWRNHRMILRAPCQFNLGLYPFDAVECQLIFQSYSYETTEITLEWLNDVPVTLMTEVLLDDYFFIKYILDVTNGTYPDGNWQQARVKFYFHRRFGYHLLQTYVPSAITVLVSWITFFMEAKFISARVTVAVTALLSLSFHFGTLEDLPRASQLKGLDVWLLLCMCFVFLSLMELALAARVNRWQRRKNLKNITVTTFRNILRTKYVNFDWLTPKGLSMSNLTANTLDKYSVWLFPLIFAACNVCYWSYYLNAL